MAKAKTDGTTTKSTKTKTTKPKSTNSTKAKSTNKTKAASSATDTTKASKKKQVVIPVDDACPYKQSGKVVGDWDCMLNQTNIGANNNKFYVIQLIQNGKDYYTWTRWGRVGETGQHAMLGNGTLASAEQEFLKKFKSKTSNNWDNRANFVAKAGKYTLIEIEHTTEAEEKAADVEEKLRALDKETAKLQPKKKIVIAPSKLAAPIQKFLSLIFDHDVFRGAMASFDIDVKKMPLGQLTKHQVQKGYEVLEDLETAINKKSNTGINDLSSKFYTLIPHAFGRKVPPPISTMDLLHKKVEMLNVLNDIEIALGMQKSKSKSKEKEEVQPNPADENYKKLKANLDYVEPDSQEYKFVETYMKNTGDSSNKLKLVDLFRVDRHGEGETFSEHDKLSERKLLWHGTNVAVVAAILGSGLRIMPHSGGRVGRGIYLASENGKSVWYVGWSGRTGIMFLTEAALGKEHTITRDNSSLKSAPKGYDCVVARGQTEPDPKHDIEWEFDGKKVIIPQGKPISQPKYKNSSFWQSEYLLYKESQVRIRYVLRVTR